ncbi:MAG: helix-turn-helix domain-containing protein [Eubacterium sp.]|nr:helix-turn-helix domain-containing protein [Eubacterium sp.]
MREEYVLKRVTQLLKERSWTLYRLAKEGEISYSTLSNSFQRNNVPSVSTLIRICEGFGITMAEFFDEGGTMPKQLTVSDQQLLTDFHRLPRNDKNLVTAYMQGLLKVASELNEEDEDSIQEQEAGESQEAGQDEDSIQEQEAGESQDEDSVQEQEAGESQEAGQDEDSIQEQEAGGSQDQDSIQEQEADESQEAGQDQDSIQNQE